MSRNLVDVAVARKLKERNRGEEAYNLTDEDIALINKTDEFLDKLYKINIKREETNEN